jgi:hypothetical protein
VECSVQIFELTEASFCYAVRTKMCRASLVELTQLLS